MSEQADTRSRILNATIDIVGLKGEVTIREITEKAGVNVAAINYYFGNKNNLLKEVENYYSELLYAEGNKILTDGSLSPREKLFRWTVGLIEFMFRFPAVINMVVNLTTEDTSYNPVIIKKIYLNDEMQGMVENIIGEVTGIKDKRLLNFKYMQLFSGILGTVINHIVINVFGEKRSFLDIDNSEELKEYAGLLIDSIAK